ncbi:MAG: type IV secretory system conjugative DNA transfer family protein [Polaromonas sp.]|nr:type IV secretory system conjugative DNA transfer family protein [Polaromonas sp.]
MFYKNSAACRFIGCIMLAAIAAFSFANLATAQIFQQCRPIPDTWEFESNEAKKAAARKREESRCTAENAIYSDWSARLRKIKEASQALSNSANSGNWGAFRSMLMDTKGMLLNLQAAANENPTAAGASQLTHLFSQGLNYSFQNAGLPPPSSLDDALLRIDAAASTKGQQSKAATLAITLLNGATSRGTEFVNGLARLASDSAKKENAALAEVQRNIRNDQKSGASVVGYLGGFGTRLALFQGVVIQWSVIATVLAAIFAFGTRRPRLVVKMPFIAFAVLVPAWLVNVLLPFLPGWLVAPVVFLAGVWLWNWTEKLPSPWSQVFQTSKIGRPSVGDFAGNMLRAFAAGKETKAPSQTSAADVAADGKNTHGSARWGTAAEMLGNGHVLPVGKPGGFALARTPDAPTGFDQRFRHIGHVVTVAPTGSGKGIGAVIPHLLEYPGSSLVLDVKGENAAVTARARRDMDQQVFIVDPFGVTDGETHSFNLLDRINPADPECVSESAALADCLVIVDPKNAGGDHFDESAKTLLQGLMLHVARLEDPAKRNLGELRRLLTADEETVMGMLADMAADDSVAFGIPARAANTLMGMADKERGSVLSTARRNTAFLDDPRIAAALARSDFNLSNIKTELMTVYLVMPANKLGTNARFVRGFVGSVIAAITSSPVQPVHHVAFLLDEFGQLGYMKAIEDAVSLLRGYGLSFWVFIQDLSQLKGVYPKWQTFLANSAKTFYGTDDFDTAKYISDSLGKSTIEYETHNQGNNKGSGLSGGGGSMNRGKSAGSSQQYAARSLLTPDEVMRLGPERPIVLVKGEYPYVLARLNYLTDPEYVGRADANPYHA